MVLAYFSCCYHASRYRALPFEGVFWRASARARYLDTTTTTTTTANLKFVRSGMTIALSKLSLFS